MTQSTLLAALAALDPDKNEHWTNEGLPLLDKLKFDTGSAVTREAVTQAAPGFTRENRVLPTASNPVGEELAKPNVEGAFVQGATDVLQTPKAEQEGAEGPADALEEAHRQLAEAHAILAEAQRYVAQKTAAVDRLIEAGAQAGKGESLGDALSHYQRRQQLNREDKARRLQALRGIDLKDILPQKENIDSAFARRTARGGQRPTR